MNRAMASSTSRSSWKGPIRCATCATWPSTNPAACGVRRSWRGRCGGPSTPPGPRPDAGPEPREAVAQLDRLAEVAPAGVGRQPEGGGELGDRELRHQRRTGSGDRDAGVAVGALPQVRRVGEGVDRVHRRPLHGEPAAARPRRGPRPAAVRRTAASTPAGVSAFARPSVMGPFQHRPPTVRPPPRAGPSRAVDNYFGAGAAPARRVSRLVADASRTSTSVRTPPSCLCGGSGAPECIGSTALRHGRIRGAHVTGSSRLVADAPRTSPGPACTSPR